MILTKKEKTMKKLFSTLTLTVCLGAFISCTNDEQEVNMVKPTNANSEIEVINDGTMIKFKDGIVRECSFESECNVYFRTS